MKEILPESKLYYRKNELTWGNIPLNQKMGQLPTPCYLYNAQVLKQNFSKFLDAAQKHNIPNPLVCYALKANANPTLLSLLASSGAGADIVSGGELKRAHMAGIPAEKIVFSGVGKTESEIDLALLSGEKGILAFNVESIEELELISQRAQEHGRIANVSLRFNPEVMAKTHKNISTGHRTHKFGIIKKDLLNLVSHKKCWKNLNFQGLSVHIGSQLLDFEATKMAVAKTCKLLKAINLPIRLLDVGGGLGMDYSPLDRKKLKNSDRLNTYMSVISREIHDHLIGKVELSPDFQVVFEPGRFIVARSGIFLSKVLRTKDSGINHFVIVDGGMNDFARTSLYGAYHELLPLKPRPGKERKTTVVGPICETTDCFASGRKLTPLRKNDFIAVADTGAYGFSMSSRYNLRELPSEFMISEDGHIRDITYHL
ncbi:MAG: diaminopimelate decarboxylase [Bdellovibrio sp.]